MTAFNPYTISWIILTPKTGKATKRDQKKFNSQITRSTFSISAFSSIMFAHFATKEIATEQLALLKKTNKDYNATIITDKQFGLMEIDYKTKNVKIHFTTKQIEDSKSI
ncbi:hypothetical protein [Epilithonimonas sp. UC225_85]|uniref:hypothetical protein n=1 Tax=Epilithonimonas sp. UC225_85 TaxID=3350167 RepID=UPI0036D3069B